MQRFPTGDHHGRPVSPDAVALVESRDADADADAHPEDEISSEELWATI